MTQLQRIEFAAAAMVCKRLGLMSHPAPKRISYSTKTPCLDGRVRHDYKRGPVCVHCGTPKGGRVNPSDAVPTNRLNGLDLS